QQHASRIHMLHSHLAHTASCGYYVINSGPPRARCGCIVHKAVDGVGGGAVSMFLEREISMSSREKSVEIFGKRGQCQAALDASSALQLQRLVPEELALQY